MLTKIRLFIACLILFIAFNPITVFAQSEQRPKDERQYEATVTKILEEKKLKLFDKEQDYQKLELEVTNKDKKGQKITIDNSALPALSSLKYKVGDRVVLAYAKNPDGSDVYYIVDYLRQDAMFWLFVIFVGLVLFVSKKKGVFSLLSMALTFLIIFTFIVPQIASGKNPVLIAILASIIIVPITFYLSHGFNKKTTVAVVGTTISLVITGILSIIFVNLTRLTGYANEQAGFIQSLKGGAFDIQGLLLAGIIISILGILDDVTVTQSSVVYQLKKANENLDLRHLYAKAMAVGKDHIASVVNTLIIVYTGAALPLLVLFINNPAPFSEIINYEIIAEEIVRTLVSSIGLILSIPLTTLLAAWIFSRNK